MNQVGCVLRVNYKMSKLLEQKVFINWCGVKCRGYGDTVKNGFSNLTKSKKVEIGREKTL